MHATGFRHFSCALLLAGASALALAAQSEAAFAAKGLQILHNSLVVSSSAYDRSQGATLSAFRLAAPHAQSVSTRQTKSAPA